jgi:hypothetical protein
MRKLGDLNNGNYDVNLSQSAVSIPDENTPVVIRWNVINSGHGTSAQYQNALNTGGPVAIDQVSDGDTNAILQTVFSLGTSLIFANCDGVVVSDTWSGTGHQIHQYMAKEGLPAYWTWDNQNTIRYILHDPGSDSPSGCGSNSDYYSGIKITRH